MGDETIGIIKRRKDNNMTTTETITPSKANRLFWLGRYAERVYTCLHIVRKCLDKMIDDDENAYRDYCTKLGIPDVYPTSDDFFRDYLYAEGNGYSLITSMRYAFDNAILLRDDIKSESLAYIELSLRVMRECAKGNAKCDDLQAVTDNMLAFWGGLEESIISRKCKDLLYLGRNLERLELHVRFHYDSKRISAIYATTCQYLSRLPEVYSKESFAEIQHLMKGSELNIENDDFDKDMIRAINSLFVIVL